MSLHTSSCPHQSAPACTNRPGCVNLSGQALVLPVLPVHISQATRTVRRHLRSSRSLAQARQICLAGKVSEGWWKQYPELWEEVGTEQEFDSILTQHDDKLLLVDFWGKTCKGCEAVYLQLCRVAGDSELKKQVRFIKVCTDGMVDRTKAEGVKALPYVGFYRGKQGKLGGSTTNPTQAKHFRRNIQTVLDNPGKIFVQDPNGFWIAKDPPTKEVTEQKAKQLAAMEEQTKNMRKHLLGAYFGESSK